MLLLVQSAQFTLIIFFLSSQFTICPRLFHPKSKVILYHAFIQTFAISVHAYLTYLAAYHVCVFIIAGNVFVFYQLMQLLNSF